jgi:hypothetical protein
MPWKTTLMLKTPCLEIRLEKNIKCTILSMQFRHFRKAHRLRWYVNIKVAYKKKTEGGIKVAYKRTDNSVNQPSGIPWPINLAFRPVCSKASVIVFTGDDPRILTT